MLGANRDFGRLLWLLPVASRSFCSSASARRLRKSDRWTRPTVWDLRRSSAVEACDVKREFVAGFGVVVRDGIFEDGLEEVIVKGVWLRMHQSSYTFDIQ